MMHSQCQKSAEMFVFYSVTHVLITDTAAALNLICWDKRTKNLKHSAGVAARVSRCGALSGLIKTLKCRLGSEPLFVHLFLYKNLKLSTRTR